MAELTWRPVGLADVPALVTLAQACLDQDGGMPSLATPDTVAGLFVGDAGIAGFDELDELVAVAALSWDAQDHPIASGLVHPSYRRQGFGEQLVAWCREHARAGPVTVVAETMSPEAESLFGSSGLRRTGAEAVMRHPLDHISRISLPRGLESLAYGPDTAAAFHAAYRLAFAERPGFPDTPADAWHAGLVDDPDFRPDDSRVAIDEDGMPAGYVIVSGDWIDQVGVVPAWRGQRLGAHLTVRSLSAIKADDGRHAWLAVTLGNPARILYERLGFENYGTRARYVDGRT
ncbi:MAG: GNAT family N-acetyltransferase [Dermatophilaceae bacterium]